MKKYFLNGAIALLTIITLSSCEDKYPDLEEGLYAEINTNRGTMIAELYEDGAPMSVANFVALAEGEHPKVPDSLQGKPFYNGLIFHRVMKGFMIQGGDITGTGSGNIGYAFDQEVSDSLKHDSKGVLSMANAGPDTNGTQFFIMHAANPGLDMRYNVFGKVREGLHVIDTIANTKVTGPKNAPRPVEDQIINSINIIRKGKAAKKYDAVEVYTAMTKASDMKREEEERQAAERKKNAPKFRNDKVEELVGLKKQAKPLSTNKEILVYYKDKGTGGKPEEGAQVALDYSGFLNTGVLFDSSSLETAQNFDAVNPGKLKMNRYEAIKMPFSKDMRMIGGFKDVVLSMNYGDDIVAFIPAHLGYGERPNGPIPANSDLIFEMKLSKPSE